MKFATQKLITKVFFSTFFFLVIQPAHAQNVDMSDNKAPSLVSISVDKRQYVEGETATITLVVRDDKNEIEGFPYIDVTGPKDAPGNIAFFFANPIPPKTSRKSANYIETTIKYSFVAPSWPGEFYSFAIQQLSDTNGNKIAIDLRTCINKDSNSSPREVAFPELTPNCNVRFSVRLLTQEEKAAAELKAKQEAEAKAAAELKAKQEAEAKAAAEKAASASKKKTITCIKGKTTKKVTAINPKCPTGYKKK